MRCRTSRWAGVSSVPLVEMRSREEAADGSGPRGHERLAVPRLARDLLSRSAPAAGMAALLRGAVRDGRGEQLVLPAPGAIDLRALARADAGRVHRHGQGEPLHHPSETPEGHPRPGEALLGASHRAGEAPGSGPVPASTQVPGRAGTAARVPRGSAEGPPPRVR